MTRLGLNTRGWTDRRALRVNLNTADQITRLMRLEREIGAWRLGRHWKGFSVLECLA